MGIARVLQHKGALLSRLYKNSNKAIRKLKHLCIILFIFPIQTSTHSKQTLSTVFEALKLINQLTLSSLDCIFLIGSIYPIPVKNVMDFLVSERLKFKTFYQLPFTL